MIKLSNRRNKIGLISIITGVIFIIIGLSLGLGLQWKSNQKMTPLPARINPFYYHADDLKSFVPLEKYGIYGLVVAGGADFISNLFLKKPTDSTNTEFIKKISEYENNGGTIIINPNPRAIVYDSNKKLITQDLCTERIKNAIDAEGLNCKNHNLIPTIDFDIENEDAINTDFQKLIFTSFNDIISSNNPLYRRAKLQLTISVQGAKSIYSLTLPVLRTLKSSLLLKNYSNHIIYDFMIHWEKSYTENIKCLKANVILISRFMGYKEIVFLKNNLAICPNVIQIPNGWGLQNCIKFAKYASDNDIQSICFFSLDYDNKNSTDPTSNGGPKKQYDYSKSMYESEKNL